MAICKKKNSLCCRFAKKDLPDLKNYASDYSEDGTFSAEKYACIYLLDKSNKCAFVYGCEGFAADFKKQLAENELHINFHKKAFENEKVAYEWFLNSAEQKTAFYKTLLVPLAQADGTVDKVLGIAEKVNAPYRRSGDYLEVAENPSSGIVSLLLRNREAEKKKIASLLHDEIGSAAVAINSLLAILKEDIKDGDTPRALTDLGKLQKAVADSMDRMKRAVVNLRPPQIDDVGLDAAVRHFIDNLSDSVPLEIDYKYCVKDSTIISDGVKIILFRTVQEALNNVLKHSGAKKAKIRIAQKEDKIVLTVEDDGIGYKEEKSRTADKLGILGMKENIAYIGGTIAIKGTAGKGTKIKVVCPIISYKRIV